jgi:hypothetical protein
MFSVFIFRVTAVASPVPPRCKERLPRTLALAPGGFAGAIAGGSGLRLATAGAGHRWVRQLLKHHAWQPSCPWEPPFAGRHATRMRKGSVR